MQHNNRGQTALNSRWALPVPGRKWHWAPSPSYFILAENRDDHHFIFGTSVPQRVSCKFISVFLFSVSSWIPLGLLSSLARNAGHPNSNILPRSLSCACCGVSLGGIEMIPSRLTTHRCVWLHDMWAHIYNTDCSVIILTNKLCPTLFGALRRFYFWRSDSSCEFNSACENSWRLLCLWGSFLNSNKITLVMFSRLFWVWESAFWEYLAAILRHREGQDRQAGHIMVWFFWHILIIIFNNNHNLTESKRCFSFYLDFKFLTRGLCYKPKAGWRPGRRHLKNDAIEVHYGNCRN